MSYGGVSNSESEALTSSGMASSALSGGLNMDLGTVNNVSPWSNKVMFTLCALCFLDSMYSLSVVAFIPEIMASESPMHAALVFSLYYIAVLFGNRIARGCGGRSFMLTCGVGCLFASTALCTLAVKNVKKSDPGDEDYTLYLRYILLGRVIQGCGSAFIQNGSLGIVLDQTAGTTETTVEEAFASVVTANAFGSAMGPCMGGLLYTIKGPESVFLTFVVLVGIAGIFCAIFVEFPEGPLPIISYEGHLRDGTLVVTSVGFTLVYLCMSLMWTTFPVHLLEVFNIKEAVVGLVFTLVLLSHDIFLPIIYTFLEIKSSEARGTYVACAFGMLGSFTMLAFMAHTWYAVCAMLFAFSFSSALAIGACSTELAERSNQNLANYQLKDAAVLVGCVVGPLLGVVVNDTVLFKTGPWHVACLCFGYVAVYYQKVANVTIKGI